MRRTFLLIVCAAILFSCNENEGPSACGVENPVEDLPWLKSSIQETESSALAQYAYLIQGTYKGQTVFSMGSCCPYCLTLVVILDCQGNVIEDAALQEVKNQKIIWRPENSTCTID